MSVVLPSPSSTSAVKVVCFVPHQNKSERQNSDILCTRNCWFSTSLLWEIRMIHYSTTGPLSGRHASQAFFYGSKTLQNFRKWQEQSLTCPWCGITPRQKCSLSCYSKWSARVLFGKGSHWWGQLHVSSRHAVLKHEKEKAFLRPVAFCGLCLFLAGSLQTLIQANGPSQKGVGRPWINAHLLFAMLSSISQGDHWVAAQGRS